MLTPSEIAAMQETCESAFPDVVTVHRPARQADGIGGTTVSEGTTASMPGRIAEPTGRDRERANAHQLVIERRLDFPFDADVESGDEIIFGDITYQVVFVSKDRSWALTGIAYLGNAT